MRCARATWIAACAASVVALFTSSAAAAEKRTVVDSAGRRVEVPAKIARVFVAGGPASVFIYTLAPDKLLGWNRPLTPEERAYIPPRYPVSGIIGCIGLLIPHFARLLVGPDFGRLLPAAMLLGAGYLLAVDTLARTIANIEVTLGVLTAFIGTPFFIWLLAASRRAWH